MPPNSSNFQNITPPKKTEKNLFGLKKSHFDCLGVINIYFGDIAILRRRKK